MMVHRFYFLLDTLDKLVVEAGEDPERVGLERIELGDPRVPCPRIG
jgi:hypothetical protein